MAFYRLLKIGDSIPGEIFLKFRRMEEIFNVSYSLYSLYSMCLTSVYAS